MTGRNHPLPRDVKRWLQDMERDLVRIRLAIGPVYSLLVDTCPDGFAAGRGEGRSSGVTDPTSTAVVARDFGASSTWDTYRRQLALVHITCETLAHELGRLQRIAPEEAQRAYSVARCADPVCEGLAVRSGFCWSHYREDLERRRREEQERAS